MLLVTDTSQFDKFMYRILSNTNNTITVDTAITNATGGESYAVIYGKLIKSSIDTTEIEGQVPPHPVANRPVKFFSDDGGADSFADGAEPFDGICEVCHTKTENQPPTGLSRYRYNEHTDTHNEGADCASCHLHKDGFSPEGACNVCHGFPPIEDVPNSSSTDANNGLVDNPGTTGSITSGAHDFHVNTMGYSDCNFCHYNSVGVGPTHNPSLVEQITLGFSLFSGTWQGGDYDGQTLIQVRFRSQPDRALARRPVITFTATQ
jgi:hypothetical protein